MHVIAFNKSAFWLMDSNPWNPALNVNDGKPPCDGVICHGTEGIQGMNDFFKMTTNTPLLDLGFTGTAADLNMLQKKIIEPDLIVKLKTCCQLDTNSTFLSQPDQN